ncbi:MAG: LysM peptidoglycan-binding domain-containing protein [Actinomycetota bacterium]|nr:LysM peptidoglycan-binding domain-containing protein [Actinomycetota bacterium]
MTLRIRLRASALVLLGTGVTLVLVTVLGSLLRRPGVGFSELLVTGSAWAVLCCTTWLLLVSASVAAEAFSAGRLRPARYTACPDTWRLRLLAVCGVALLAGVGPAAAAGPGGSGDHGSPGVDGLPLPDRPVGALRHRVPAQPTGHRSPERPRLWRSSRLIVVAPGDSLWRIASRLLPPDADDGAVARATTALYQANRAAIGADPDLILPGLRLRIPHWSRSNR